MTVSGADALELYYTLIFMQGDKSPVAKNKKSEAHERV